MSSRHRVRNRKRKYAETDERPSSEPLFRTADFREIYNNKYVAFVGDSVVRNMYYDLVAALQKDELPTTAEMRAKGCSHFMGDVLLYRSALLNDRHYSEVREYHSQDDRHVVRYYFTPRSYCDQVRTALADCEKDPPDIIFMNSCLWDINRYGENFEQQYRDNVARLCSHLRQLLPATTQVVWLTSLPTSNQVISSMLPMEVKFLESSMPITILKANYALLQIITKYGFDVLDLNLYFRQEPLIQLRVKDGLHWMPEAHRHMSYLMATWVCEASAVCLPKDVRARIRNRPQHAAATHLMDRCDGMFNGIPEFVRFRSANIREVEAVLKMRNCSMQEKRDMVADLFSANSRSNAPAPNLQQPLVVTRDFSDFSSDSCSPVSIIDLTCDAAAPDRLSPLISPLPRGILGVPHTSCSYTFQNNPSTFQTNQLPVRSLISPTFSFASSSTNYTYPSPYTAMNQPPLSVTVPNDYDDNRLSPYGLSLAPTRPNRYTHYM